MGSLNFASESHKEGNFGNYAITEETGDHFRDVIEKKNYDVTKPNQLRVGDATYHSGWVLHRAGENRTDRTRKVMTIIYYEDGARFKEPENQEQEKDLERWFPGLDPSDQAASPLNPLVYSRPD
jgi:ectoine hydroxylase-related dioxygenase (phytanoyl-CoA dioxygenase family)